MPFGRNQSYQKFINRYQKIIKVAVDGFRIKGKEVFECIRADEVSRTGSVTYDLLIRLWKADVVVADLTDLNPNVFYELGVRHALRSGTLLLADEECQLPFDVHNLRVIRYKDCLGGEKTAVQAIRKALITLLKDPVRKDSPVLHALSGEPGCGEFSGASLPTWLDGKDWRLKDGRIVSPVDGIWLEILDRRERQVPARHYSFFRFQYDKASHVDPFIMTGHSFRSDGQWHSSWSTKYLRIKTPRNKIGVTVEYVFRADIGGGEQRSGYGISRFLPDGTTRLVTGSGSYLAGEENPPYRCDYQLQRIDAAFQKMLGVSLGSFDKEHLRALVPLLRSRYEPDEVQCEEKPTSDRFLLAAIKEAQKSLLDGGIPIGSVLVINNKVVARGHNRRVQDKSPVLHAEMDCLNNAGRLGPQDYRRSVLYSTLSPCDMCTGAVLLYKIPRVIIGENRNFRGPEQHLRSSGVELQVLNDSACIELMRTFIQTHPRLWNEDIGETDPAT